MNIEAEEEREVDDGSCEDHEAADDALEAVAVVVLGQEVEWTDFPDFVGSHLVVVVGPGVVKISQKIVRDNLVLVPEVDLKRAKAGTL